MTDLTTKQRKGLPSSDFGLPGKRAYPMPNKAHAANAKARATQEEKAGRLSPADKAKIDAKADKILGEKRKPKVEGHDGGSQLPKWNASRERRFQKERGK